VYDCILWIIFCGFYDSVLWNTFCVFNECKQWNIWCELVWLYIVKWFMCLWLILKCEAFTFFVYECMRCNFSVVVYEYISKYFLWLYGIILWIKFFVCVLLYTMKYILWLCMTLCSEIFTLILCDCMQLNK